MAYPTLLRKRAVAYLQTGGTYAEAARIFQVCPKTVYNRMRRYLDTGELHPRPGPGKPRRLDYEILQNYVASHADHTLHELGRYFGVSYRTIDQALKTMKITRKKTLRYAERDEQCRTTYLEAMEGLPPERLVYIDESGIDEPGSYRRYGRAPQGVPVLGEISGKRATRFSFIAAFNDHQLKAPFRFEGTTNTDVFNLWLKECLVPTLRPGQIVVMDNARFHKSATTQDLITAARCELCFLPPYSLDLNPIEPVWAIVKARIRRDRLPEQSFVGAIDQQLQQVNII